MTRAPPLVSQRWDTCFYVSSLKRCHLSSFNIPFSLYPSFCLSSLFRVTCSNISTASHEYFSELRDRVVIQHQQLLFIGDKWVLFHWEQFPWFLLYYLDRDEGYNISLKRYSHSYPVNEALWGGVVKRITQRGRGRVGTRTQTSWPQGPSSSPGWRAASLSYGRLIKLWFQALTGVSCLGHEAKGGGLIPGQGAC